MMNEQDQSMKSKKLPWPKQPVRSGAVGLLRTACALRLLLLLLLTLPAVVQAQFNYTINDGTIAITSYTGPGGVVVIPATINGLPVTSIGEYAFRNVTSLTSVTIPNSVTNIGDSAFYLCTSLTNVAIPSSVTSIGDWTFAFCTSLASATIGSGVTYIGNYAFNYSTSLTAIAVDADNSTYGSVDGVLFNKSRTTLLLCPQGKTGNYTIPDSVTSVGFAAFYSCASLTSVTIPNSVTSIGQNVFYSCTSLTSVTIPIGVTSIGVYAFSGCTSLTAITVDVGNATYGNVDGVLFNKSRTTLFLCPGGKTGNYTIPDSVTSIRSSAFDGCASLVSVTIPNSVTSIEAGAFSGCASLTRLIIPNSVTSIGYGAFYGCTSLGTVTIGSGVTYIGDYAFNDCISLTTITMDAGNSNYGSVDGVLFNKSQTTLFRFPQGKTGNYTIPDSVTRIGYAAFYGCTGLASVTIPGSVTSIGWSGFYLCTSLARITICSSVTSIESYAFYYCTNLNGVYFQGNAPSVGSSSFVDATATVYYLPGTTGWGPTFGGRPTALWKPLVQVSDASVGVRSNLFGFNINWAGGRVVVVEACTDLAQPLWSPVGTNTLTDGLSYFSDPQRTNHPARFYRLRSP